MIVLRAGMARRARAVLGVLVLLGCAHVGTPTRAADGDAFLFSYFTRNGEDGLHLAYSVDGTTWLPLNGARSLLTPMVKGQGVGWQQWDTKAALMRDPSIVRGPDGVFHMVWTRKLALERHK